MKGCLIYLGRRGAGPMYALEMAQAMSLSCKLLCVISSYTENLNLWRELAERNGNIQLLEVKTYRNKIEFLLRSLNVGVYVKICKAVNVFEPKFVYSPMGHFWQRFIVPYLRCKCKIQTIHDPVLHKGEDSLIRKCIMRFFDYKSDRYIILSDVFKKQLIQSGIKEKDILIVPHATFNTYNHGAVFDSKKYNRFLFFGRIIKYKGLDVLLRSLEYVLRDCPEAKLVIAGNGNMGEYEVLLDKYKTNIDLHIEWIRDEDVKKYFEQVDFVVLPYTQATQSGVIPLSYSFGKPVIATRLGGLPEQIIENKTGVVITPDSEHELGEAIVSLLKNDDKLAYMKEQSLEYGKTLSWEASANAILEFVR